MNNTTCQHCNTEIRRSSTPTINEDGSKTWTRHIDTGMSLCPERIAAERA
jgi:hypothetical protein